MRRFVVPVLIGLLVPGCLGPAVSEQDLRNVAQAFYQTHEGSIYVASYDTKANALYLGEADSGAYPSETNYRYRIADAGGKCLFLVKNPKKPSADGRPLEIVMDLTKFSLRQATVYPGSSAYDPDRQMRIPIEPGAISEKIYNSDGTTTLRDSGQRQATVLINLKSPPRDGFSRTMLERVQALAAKCN